MKNLLILLALLPTPTFATNVMYAPAIDPGTKQPSIIYLTDSHSAMCQGKWYLLTIISDKTGRSLMPSDMCWSFGAAAADLDFKIPATGFFNTSSLEGFAPVPNTNKEWMGLINQKFADDLQATRDFKRALSNANPHP